MGDMEKEIKKTTPEIERCGFCGQLVFTAVACPWTGGAVHMAHYTDVRIRRVPWADKYGSSDNIPPKAFIDNGWWMFCCKCSAHVDADHLGGYRDDGQPYCQYCMERAAVR